MNKPIDITKYDDFIDAGFKECSKCGWTFDPKFFDDHACIDVMKEVACTKCGEKTTTNADPKTFVCLLCSSS